MYAIYDSVAEVFNSPFVDLNDASAIRQFSFSVNKDNIPDDQRGDFVLYKVAEYNDASGKVEGIEPQRIYSGLEVAKAA